MAIKGMDGLENFLVRVAEDLPEIMASGVLKAADFVAGVIREVVIEDFPGGKGGLARSFKASLVFADDEGASAKAVSNLIYAEIHDTGGPSGGVIRPKTRKNLAIPLRQLPIGKWPRHFAKGELTYIVSKKGNKLLVDTRALKRGKIVPVYLLRPSVKITPTRYLLEAELRSEDDVEEILADHAIARIEKMPVEEIPD